MSNPNFTVREVATETVAREAATATERMFAESEHEAILAHAITAETASLKAEKEALASNLEEERAAAVTKDAEHAAEVARLQGENDTLTAERDTARQEIATAAETAAAAAREGDRVAKVREAAAHLTDAFFTPERAQRWGAMSDVDFEVALADLAAAATPGGTAPGTRDTARESASLVTGAPATPNAEKATSFFGMI